VSPKQEEIYEKIKEKLSEGKTASEWDLCFISNIGMEDDFIIFCLELKNDGTLNERSFRGFSDFSRRIYSFKNSLSEHFSTTRY
jgi:hypothetical protein